jgi:CheY-like chemotaxis protein
MPQPVILIVDDNKITTKLMRRYLESHGFDVMEAHDGIECLLAVADRPPQGIIMDVMMPRMDGYEATAALKANPETAHIPVAIVTALNDTATQLRAVEAGADDFLSKPLEEMLLIRKATLLTAIGQQAERSQRMRFIIQELLAGRKDTLGALLEGEGF